MSEQVSLVVVRNPFDRRIRDERLLTFDTMPTVADMVRVYLPMSPELSISVDGELITSEEWALRTLKPGEQMIVLPMVQKGGNGILSAVLMIAVMVMAPYAAAYLNTAMSLGFAAGGVGMGLLSAGIAVVGSMVIGGLLGFLKPPPTSNTVSQAYGWNPATTQVPGAPIARAYGTHKLYGNIIAGYVEDQSTSVLNQIAHFLIDLGTGPYSQLSDFQINDQPAAFFTNVTVTARMGYVNQDTIPGFNDTVATYNIGAKVVNGTPIVRQTVGNEYDALEVLLTCPQGLWYANDSGGLDNVSVQVSVEISADNGNTWQFVTNSAGTITSVPAAYWSCGHWSYDYNGDGPINGSGVWVEVQKGSSVPTAHVEGDLQNPGVLDGTSNVWHWIAQPTTVATTVNEFVTVSGSSQSQVAQQVNIPNLARGTRYLVRVTNYSTDYSANSRYGDALYFAELNEVVHGDFQYPRTVLVGVNALATNQLSGSIKFSCMAQAAIVQVWNGSAWVSQWSNNPAWVCWDILTQPVLDNNLNVVRYDGLDPSRLDLPSFTAWAAFCNVLVPDGLGGSEPRCCYDGVFDTLTTLWDAALQVCNTARAQLVMRGTTISVVYDDARATPAQLFTVGNTLVSGFTETFLATADRAASIEVSYINANTQYNRDTLTVVNTAITESTALRANVSLVGIRRSSQAWREANYRLAWNELLQTSASINVDIDAIACTVGDLVWLQHDVPQWGVGGRAGSGSTTTHLVLDQSVTLVSGTTYELKLRLDDDTLLTRTITTAPGTVAAVDVSVPFPSAPALYAPWAIGEIYKSVKQFLVLNIMRSSDQIAKINLIEYNASLYGLDAGIPDQPTPDVSGTIAVSVLPGALAELAAAQAAVDAANQAIAAAAAQAAATQAAAAATAQAQALEALLTAQINAGAALSAVSAAAAAAGNIPLVLDITTSEGMNLAQDGSIQFYLDLHFDLVNAAKVDVYDGAQVVGSATASSFRYQNVTSGQTFNLSLHPFNSDGVSPSLYWQPVTYTVLGKNAPPSDVASLTASLSADGGVDLTWPEITDLDRSDYGICEGAIWAEPITWVSGTSFHISTPAPGSYVWRVRARNTSAILSAHDTTDTLVISAGGNIASGGTAVSVATVTVDALGNAQITFVAIQDPQITSYELRSGNTFESGTKLAATSGSSFSLPVLSLTGLTLWIKGVYATGGYTTASFRIAFGTSSLDAIQGLSWRISEPDMVFSWDGVAGASQYVVLFEDGGVSTVQVVATAQASVAIPKWANAVFRVFAIASSGGMSPYADETITLTGVYNYNEVVNITLPITTGKYINMAFTAANQVKRVSLLGAAPANGISIQNINDSGLYSFGYNLRNVAASGLTGTAAAWFRNDFWEEQNGFFESGVVDLGAVLSGKLLLNLSKTVAYAGTGAVSGYSQVNSGYMSGNYPQELTDTKAFLTVQFMVASDSPNSANWTEVQNGDWVTSVRYVKLVVSVALAGPLTDVTVTSGFITLDVPDVTESGSLVGVTSAGVALTFAKTYHHVSLVLATAQGAAKAYTDTPTLTGCHLFVDTGTQTVGYFVKGY